MKAHVRQHNGTPTLFLNDEPVYANVQWVGHMDLSPEMAATQDSIRAFAEAGVHIYTTDSIGADWVGPREGQPGIFDFSMVQPRLQAILDADPDGLLNLRLMFETRYLADNWWNKTYPDEVEVLSEGDALSASYASPVWHSQVKDLLLQLIAHLREIGLYDRVIGYQICTGTCGEWIKSWSSMDPPSGDFSAPMVRAFRGWLRRRYQDDATALQAAWGNDQVTFETAEVPSGEAQDTTTHFIFRDPRRERNVVDFYECYAEITAETLLDFCRTVKEATNGDKLTGAFFGYLLDLAWNDCFFNDNFGDARAAEVSTIQRSGHLGLARALRSPDIDFFVSPYSYAFRGRGGDGLPMQPTDSLRIHGKLYLFEEDTLMHNNFEESGRMHPKDQNIPIYQRNFAQIVTHGIGVTWLENMSFPEHPSIVDEAHAWQKRFSEIGQWAVNLDRSPRSEVAVFLDDESYMYEANRNSVDLPMIAHQRVVTLNRFGAPHDLYLLDDLLEGRLPEYKLYIFLNVYHLNNRRREALKQAVRRDNKTALWFYAPGYINSDAAEAPLHTDQMTDLTGFSFGRGGSYWSQLAHITNFAHPITQGIPQDLFWGNTRAVAPLFHIEDTQAEILGEVVYALGRCKPGLGIKTFNPDSSAQRWNSVYSATPSVPAPVLRGIARHAGVHLYNEAGDVLYATPDLLSAHSVSGGQRAFKLPRKAEVVYDLFHKKVLAHDAAEFCVELAPMSTALYYTGSAEMLGLLDGDSVRALA